MELNLLLVLKNFLQLWELDTSSKQFYLWMFDANDQCQCATARASQLASSPWRKQKVFLELIIGNQGQMEHTGTSM